MATKAATLTHASLKVLSTGQWTTAIKAKRKRAAVNYLEGGMGHAGAPRMNPIRDLLSIAARNGHRIRLTRYEGDWI